MQQQHQSSLSTSWLEHAIVLKDVSAGLLSRCYLLRARFLGGDVSLPTVVTHEGLRKFRSKALKSFPEPLDVHSLTQGEFDKDAFSNRKQQQQQRQQLLQQLGGEEAVQAFQEHALDTTKRLAPLRDLIDDVSEFASTALSLLLLSASKECVREYSMQVNRSLMLVHLDLLVAYMRVLYFVQTIPKHKVR